VDEQFRRAGPEDAVAVRELTRTAYAKWVPVIGREPKPMAADYDRAVRDHLIDLIYRNNMLVGLIEMTPQPDHILIENVAVAPPYWGLGYGRKLMLQAEKVAISFGLQKTRLYTNQLFAENVLIYRKLKYRVDREEMFSGSVVVHMSKHLS
jgi:N-acetylglutamate synthase-like GNAT family acetyltransferase